MKTSMIPHLSRGHRIALGGAALLAMGAAGGAGAVQLTRPSVEMAPTIPTAIAKLPASNGIVTVRGRVAGVYGTRFLVEDASGRTLVDAGRGAGTLTTGAPVLVQGRFDDGQLRARFLADQGGVREVGAPPPPPPPPPSPGLAHRPLRRRVLVLRRPRRRVPVRHRLRPPVRARHRPRLHQVQVRRRRLREPALRRRRRR
ncbi:hypothetical protein QP166_02795 [Sphingomonas sp. LR60]|uniref:hypothetical protein n=1 Tax=Sphingomonas sp. LR60 TaxID=3050233 RepID=UPI002FE3E80F